MDALPRFVEEIKRNGWARQHLEGFLHVLIGRRIKRVADGAVVSTGVSWRELAAALKKVRWDPDAVGELGFEPKQLPPRDRERYWYTLITKAQLDSRSCSGGRGPLCRCSARARLRSRTSTARIRSDGA